EHVAVLTGELGEALTRHARAGEERLGRGVTRTLDVLDVLQTVRTHQLSLDTGVEQLLGERSALLVVTGVVDSVRLCSLDALHDRAELLLLGLDLLVADDLVAQRLLDRLG